MAESMTAMDKRFRAESDAHTLTEAELINGDKTRLSAAQTAAKRLAEEAEKRAQSLKKISKKVAIRRK